MRYPHGRCESCGERLYEHTDGVVQCLNCETVDPGGDSGGEGEDEDGDGDGGRAVPVAM